MRRKKEEKRRETGTLKTEVDRMTRDWRRMKTEIKICYDCDRPNLDLEKKG